MLTIARALAVVPMLLVLGIQPSSGQSLAEQCISEFQRAEARVNSVIQRLKKLPELCPPRDSGLAPRIAELEGKVDELGRKLGDKDKELEAARAQLAAVLPTIAGAARSRLQALTPALRNECEAFRIDAKGPAGFIMSGSVRDVASIKAQVATILREFPAVSVDMSNLTQVAVCGVTLAGGYLIETAAEGGFREVQRAEARDKADQVPRREDCERVGAAIDEARSAGKSSIPPRFWILRPDAPATTPILDLCARDDQGTWSWTDTQLSGRRALVVVKQK